MTSPLLALFTRSLREDTRAKLTYFARGGVVGLVLLFGVLASMNGSSWATGLNFFTTLIYLQLMCVTIAGIGFFASAITEEKEEMTLGLLRMTNLNPLSILLGKSTSRLCAVLLLLAAPVPFTVMAVTLGGISLGQIGASYCTLAAYTFFLCNLALLASVIARNTGIAGAFTVVALAVFFGAAGVVQAMFSGLTWLEWAAEDAGKSIEAVLSSISPFSRISRILTTGFSGAAVDVQVISNLLFGIGFFLLAWLCFARCCDRALDSTAPSTPGRRFLGFRLARPPRPWTDALAWKEFYFQTGGRRALVLRILVYGMLTIMALVSMARADPKAQYEFLTLWAVSFLPFVFSLDVAFMAGRVFRLEVRDQTLAALAALPRALETIVWRKVRGCVIAAVPGALAVLIVTIPSLILMLGASDRDAGRYFAGHRISQYFGYVFLWCLVAYLSLFLKRGALPLGYILNQVASVLISALFMVLTNFGSGRGAWSGYPQFMAFGSSIFYLVASVVLIRRMSPRLQALAGEG